LDNGHSRYTPSWRTHFVDPPREFHLAADPRPWGSEHRPTANLAANFHVINQDNSQPLQRSIITGREPAASPGDVIEGHRASHRVPGNPGGLLRWDLEWRR
jgi:hypothetical protein